MKRHGGIQKNRKRCAGCSWSLALIGTTASVVLADDASQAGFGPGDADPTSELAPTSSGLEVYVNDDVIEWAKDRLGVEAVTVSDAAEARADYWTRGLGPAQRALLQRQSRIGVTMDVDNQKITSVVDRDAFAGDITPFGLTLTTGCADNATSQSCVFVNAPGAAARFTVGPVIPG